MDTTVRKITTFVPVEVTVVAYNQKELDTLTQIIGDTSLGGESITKLYQQLKDAGGVWNPK